MDDRTALIADICGRILEEVGGFEYADTGAKLSWLTLAIAEGKRLEYDYDAPFLRLLRRLFPCAHGVWKYAKSEQTVICVVCCGEIPVLDAVLSEEVGAWMHPGPCPGDTSVTTLAEV